MSEWDNLLFNVYLYPDILQNFKNKTTLYKRSVNNLTINITCVLLHH